jgi:hypothetical protein
MLIIVNTMVDFVLKIVLIGHKKRKFWVYSDLSMFLEQLWWPNFPLGFWVHHPTNE